jgi:hypothetical protein
MFHVLKGLSYKPKFEINYDKTLHQKATERRIIENRTLYEKSII